MNLRDPALQVALDLDLIPGSGYVDRLVLASPLAPSPPVPRQDVVLKADVEIPMARNDPPLAVDVLNQAPVELVLGHTGRVPREGATQLDGHRQTDACQ